jgi:hypothetical protein
VRRLAATAGLFVSLLAACSGGGVVKIKDPGPVPDMTTTTALDLSSVGLKGVSNKTTTSIPMGPGGATMAGTVVGPDGGVEAATVHVERLVGSAAATMDLQTAPDGTWSLPAIFGGRYRVRAWRAPDLALVTPEVFYLQSSETKTLNLRVDRYAGAAATASIAPNPPVYGGEANLFVLVTEKTVAADGVVRGVPVPGAGVELGGSGFQVETTNPTSTDSDGVAEWRIQCTSYAQGALSVTVANGGSFPLAIPACVNEGTTNTTASVTSTTVRRATTTRRPTTTRAG